MATSVGCVESELQVRAAEKGQEFASINIPDVACPVGVVSGSSPPADFPDVFPQLRRDCFRRGLDALRPEFSDNRIAPFPKFLVAIDSAGFGRSAAVVGEH